MLHRLTALGGKLFNPTLRGIAAVNPVVYTGRGSLPSLSYCATLPLTDSMHRYAQPLQTDLSGKSNTTSEVTPVVYDGQSPILGLASPLMSPATDNAQLHKLHTKQAYDNYEADFGINIREASSRNLARVRAMLGELTAEEKLLAEFFINSLTAKHKTYDYKTIKRDGALISVGERERTERKVHNRHVRRSSGDDNIFFTVGIGNHDTPRFLEENSGGHTIELRLKGLFEDYEPQVGGLFVSCHLSDYYAETISRPVSFGGTFYQFTHDWKSKTKTYTYQYIDGEKIVRTVPMADEIFCGKDLLEGLALQFIEQLRMMGQTYHRHILRTLVDPTITIEQKTEVISVAMRNIMPGWMYPEAKLPGMFVLDPKNAHLVIHDDSTPAVTSGKMDWTARDKTRELIKDALASSDLAQLAKLIDEGKLFVKGSLFELIDEPSFRNRKATAEFLVARGADISAINYRGLEPLAKAATVDDIEMLDILLSIRTPDSKDPYIFHRANLNHSKGFDGERNLLEELSYLGHYEALEKLLKAGGVIKNSAVALSDAAEITYKKFNEHRFFAASSSTDDPTIHEDKGVITFVTLLKNGADIREKLRYGKTALMQFTERGNIVGIRMALSYGAPVNERFHFLHRSRLVGRNYTDSPENGYTALHFLMSSDSPEYEYEDVDGQKNRITMAQALLDQGADANIRADNGDTAYSLAVSHGHIAIAEMLEARGVDTRMDKTPIENCASHQRNVVAVVKGINKDGKEVVLMGKKMGNDGKLKPHYLMPGGFEDPADETPVTSALRELQEETGVDLTPLVESGVIKPEILHTYETVGGSGNTHYRTTYVLFNAGRHLEGMKLVGQDDLYAVAAVPLDSITMRPELSIRPGNALIIGGLIAGNLSADARLQLDALTNIELDGEYQLVKATQAGDLEKVAYLLAMGVPPDPDDDFKGRPILTAAMQGRLDVVKALVEAGAVLSRGGITRRPEYSFHAPLSAAVISGNNDLFDYLLPPTLQLLNNPKEVDSEEECPLKPENILKDVLEYAAKEGNIYVANKILATGVIGPNDSNLCSPLVYAAKAGHKAMVEYLLSKGADVNIACDDDSARFGRCIKPSTILAAMEAGHPDIALLLLRQSAVDVNKHRVCSDQELCKTIPNPLFAAIHFDQAELALWILEHTNIQLSTRQQLRKGWRPEVGLTAFEFALKNGQSKLAAAIAKKMVVQRIAEQLKVDNSSIQMDVQSDETGKATLHIMMFSRKNIESLAIDVNAPVKQDPGTGKFYIRLGEVRLGRLLENGKQYYAAIAAELKPAPEKPEELAAVDFGAGCSRLA